MNIGLAIATIAVAAVQADVAFDLDSWAEGLLVPGAVAHADVCPSNFDEMVREMRENVRLNSLDPLRAEYFGGDDSERQWLTSAGVRSLLADVLPPGVDPAGLAIRPRASYPRMTKVCFVL